MAGIEHHLATMKPILIGKDSLAPWPPGVGSQLIALAIAADDSFSEDEYVHSFERRTLWPYKKLQDRSERSRALRRRGKEIARQIKAQGRTDALLLGATVWNSVTARRAIGWFKCMEIDGCRFWYLPQPSKSSRLLNDPKVRRRLGRLVVQIARRNGRDG